MRAAKHDESKSDFQLERLIMFNDGIFAIAITILVYEIKVPALTTFTDHALLQTLAAAPFKFFGFLMSFVIIGHFWSVHHRIFGYIKKTTPYLFWVNLGFLFSIAVLPFSSGLFGEYSAHTEMHVPYLVYAVNMCFVGAMNLWLWLFVSDPKKDLLTHKISKARIQLGVARSLVIPCVFLLSLFLSLYSSVLARCSLILIPVILKWGMRKLEHKADTTESAVSG
jgi:uncharacterized membrane protein